MPSHDERGAALILALLVLALLATLVLQFDAEARRELKGAVAFRDEVKARTLTHAAAEAARAVLKEAARDKRRRNQTWDDLNDLWTTPVDGFQLGDGVVSARLADERGKLNLNDLGTTDLPLRRLRVERLKRLFDLLGLDPRLVDPIADWVDRDDVPEPDGAEDGHYARLVPPYRPANGPLKAVGELSLVKGMTQAIIQRLQPYVTVYPTNSDGWINLNTADVLVIQALDNRITRSMAEEIAQARPFRSIQDADRVTSFEPIAKSLRLAKVYDVKTDHLSGRLVVTVESITKLAHAVFRWNGTTGNSTLLSFRID